LEIGETIRTYKLEQFVKDILIFRDEDETKIRRLSFFADGYPGVFFNSSVKEVTLMPKSKKLSELFIYGQTIEPIEISVEGKYLFIVFQLYPFSVKTLFGVSPKDINDDCYDLVNSRDNQGIKLTERLFAQSDLGAQIEIIAKFLLSRVEERINLVDQKIEMAIGLILNSKGKITVKGLTKTLHTTERTLQRQFEEYVGIPPKQFAKIIQFQNSLSQISDDSFSRLTEIVYENGYADQSHFIRSFKKFTGKRPSEFKVDS
jgi:AraC-like DNA-binding protein